MVWSLCPVDPLSGDEKFYIFSNGTYTVGRKGCDVIVKSDKSVSRVHAKIVVGSKDGTACTMCLKDCSKYGTFITKRHDLKEKVNDCQNKETTVEEGDVLSFGTGNAIYRLALVPLVFFFYSIDSLQRNGCEKAASFGARIVDQLTDDCTHVVVVGLLPINEEVLDIIISEKHIVLQSWVDILAEKNVRPEFPSCCLHIPSVKFEGISVKLAEPRSRASCLQGYTCILNPKELYRIGDKLKSLLKIGGALIAFVEDFCHDSQELKVDSHNQVLYVIPSGSSNMLSNINKLPYVYRVKEVDIVCAVLSGRLDPSILLSPLVNVSSSCSTDDTVVADSDAETETTSSDNCLNKSIDDRCANTDVSNVQKDETTVSEQPTTSYISPKKLDCGMATRSPTLDVLSAQKFDIIVSQDLITRRKHSDRSILSANPNLPNFKCFKKKNSQSGNSFTNLIPYSKNPYRELDYENKYSRESIKEEKKRKQMEAIAEDLFVHDKPRKKAIAGALQGLFSTR